jgi:hypothetical protein
MLDQRSLYRDLFALALVAVVIFLALALASYDPADPVAIPVAPLHLLHQPLGLVHPPHLHVGNVCGYWGALAAEALFTWFGVGAYYTVFSLGARLPALGARDRSTRAHTGWLATLAGITTIAAIAFPTHRLPGDRPAPPLGRCWRDPLRHDRRRFSPPAYARRPAALYRLRHLHVFVFLYSLAGRRAPVAATRRKFAKGDGNQTPIWKTLPGDVAVKSR